MPHRIKSICSHPGCNTITLTGKCERHKRVPDARPSARERGYDHRWTRLRNTFIRSNPICQIQHYCDGAPAVEVDHIVPIRAGGARLDQDNLQAVCKRCHAWKTATQDAQHY